MLHMLHAFNKMSNSFSSGIGGGGGGGGGASSLLQFPSLGGGDPTGGLLSGLNGGGGMGMGMGGGLDPSSMLGMGGMGGGLDPSSMLGMGGMGGMGMDPSSMMMMGQGQCGIM